ncbi:MAG: hypothetical protein V3V97_18625 [Hyphomicrobiaceae bacterium]
MSIKAIPLLVFSLIAYNAIVFLGGDQPPHQIFAEELFSLTMPNGGEWFFTLSDLLMVMTLVLLCIEVIKATYTRGSGLADQALSMILFVIFLVEFLLVKKAATSLFFLMTLTSGIDVIAGAIVGIRTARRDFGFGSDVT